MGNVLGVRLTARPALEPWLWMPPDFLNSREDALLLWVVVIVAYACYASRKSGGGLGASFVAVVRAFLAPKVLLVFSAAAAYAALVVLVAQHLGLWHATALKETIYWFVGVGVILVGEATSASPDQAFFTKILKRAFTFTIIIEFIVNLYVFPFLVEMVLVIIIILFFGMQAVARYDSKIDALTLKVIDRVLITIGVFLLASFVVRALFDLDGFLTRENAERLLVVPAMTVAFIPFLYVVAWYSQRELANLRKQFIL